MSESSADAPGPRPWTRADRVLLGVLALTLAVSLIFTVHTAYDARNDSSLYLVVLEAFRSGEGLTYLGEPFVIRPPGFVYLLAPVASLFGTDASVLNLYVSWWGVLLALLLYLYLRPTTGGPLAAAAGLVVWLSPGVQELCNQVMSDVPGAALLLACLLLERATRERGLAWQLGLGVAIGLAGLVRTMDLLLVPAVIGARLVDALWRTRGLPRERGLWLGCGAVLAGALVVSLPWTLHAGRSAPEGHTDQSFIHSYGVAQWHADPSDPASPEVSLGEFLGRSSERVPEALHALGSRLTDQEGGGLSLGLAALGLVCVLVQFLRRRDPGTAFVLGALLVVGTYFAFKPRLVLPLYVLGVGAIFETIALLTGRSSRRALAEALTAAAFVVLALFTFEPLPVEQIEVRDRVRRRIAARLDELSEPGEVLAAATGWHIGVHLPDNPVVSLRFAYLRAGRDGRPPGAAVLEVVDQHRVDLVALYNAPGREDRAIGEALTRRGGERLELVEQFEGWVILRVRR